MILVTGTSGTAGRAVLRGLEALVVPKWLPRPASLNQSLASAGWTLAMP